MKQIKDKPWVIRTYAGHSTAEASNKLYRENLSKGQTGLSVAFDLPTQTGYDSDFILSKGEVGKVGVPISHIGNMMTLFDLKQWIRLLKALVEIWTPIFLIICLVERGLSIKSFFAAIYVALIGYSELPGGDTMRILTALHSSFFQLLILR